MLGTMHLPRLRTVQFYSEAEKLTLHIAPRSALGDLIAQVFQLAFGALDFSLCPVDLGRGGADLGLEIDLQFADSTYHNYHKQYKKYRFELAETCRRHSLNGLSPLY